MPYENLAFQKPRPKIVLANVTLPSSEAFQPGTLADILSSLDTENPYLSELVSFESKGLYANRFSSLEFDDESLREFYLLNMKAYIDVVRARLLDRQPPSLDEMPPSEF